MGAKDCNLKLPNSDVTNLTNMLVYYFNPYSNWCDLLENTVSCVILFTNSPLIREARVLLKLNQS